MRLRRIKDINMKQMTEMENIIMTRSGVNRETANLIANDIIQILDRDGDLKDPSDYKAMSYQIIQGEGILN